MNKWATIFTILRYYFFITHKYNEATSWHEIERMKKARVCLERERNEKTDVDKKVFDCICVDYVTMTVSVCHAFSFLLERAERNWKIIWITFFHTFPFAERHMSLTWPLINRWECINNERIISSFFGGWLF